MDTSNEMQGIDSTWDSFYLGRNLAWLIVHILWGPLNAATNGSKSKCINENLRREEQKNSDQDSVWRLLGSDYRHGRKSNEQIL